MDTSKAINEFHCLQSCKSEPDCQWFTFYPKLGMCENLANCSNIDSESCPECLSGQKECTGEPVCRVPGTFFDSRQAKRIRQICSTLACLKMTV